MRVLVHDFAGHPFAAQLSRELARRGHEVVHGYCGGVTTGRGALELHGGDPEGLRFHDVSEAPFERYSPVKRIKCEIAYGRQAAALVKAERFDVVLSANCPLLAQAQIWRAADEVGTRKVYWLQDFLGRGTRTVLTEKSRLLGSTMGAAWERLEERLLRKADQVVAITEDFVPELRIRNVHTDAQVIPNWTPLDEVPIRPKRNAWSKEHDLHDRPVALYAGTLGYKHDPEHLVIAAEVLAPTGAAVVVASEGMGRDHLERRKAELGLDNLLLFDFVPWEDVPDLLGTADVCLVLLEPDAGMFSAPSKVLTYLAAGRPIVGAMPWENLATRTIDQAGAGMVVQPGDHAGFAAAAATALADAAEVERMGLAARAHAESAFDVAAITDQFEVALDLREPEVTAPAVWTARRVEPLAGLASAHRRDDAP